jgi:hypothetical protein
MFFPARSSSFTEEERITGLDRCSIMNTLMKKAAWTGLYASLGAVATMAARRVASRIWRSATGEPPPAKR